MVDDPSLHRFVYQPIVDLQRGAVVGYEMLSRFEGPPASPDKWFAVADRLGLGPTLQVRTLRHAIDQLAELPANTFLTVNLDPKLIATDAVIEVIEATESLDRIVIELTEQTVAADPDVMMTLLTRAKQAGAVVAVDDVGAGYSGLQALLAVRPQIVKLDRSLVSGMDHDPARTALVEMLGEFVGRLDGWVLAEGLETLAELRACVDLGVPLGQGYLLGRPAAQFATEIPEAVATAIAHRVGAREFGDTLAPLLDVVPAATSPEQARDLLMTDASHDCVVVVDDDHFRPVGLLTRARAAAGDAPVADLLLARISESTSDVARRVATRAVGCRFDPIVCRDGKGRYQGIVTIDRLLRKLAE